MNLFKHFYLYNKFFLRKKSHMHVYQEIFSSIEINVIVVKFEKFVTNYFFDIKIFRSGQNSLVKRKNICMLLPEFHLFCSGFLSKRAYWSKTVLNVKRGMKHWLFGNYILINRQMKFSSLTWIVFSAEISARFRTLNYKNMFICF